MKQLTHFFKTNAAKQLYTSLTANTSSHYVAVASSNSVSSANTQYTISDIVYELDKQILYGNKVQPTNVSLTIKNNAWISGNVYDMYDDSEIFSSNIYVVVDEADTTKSVFKCLKNKRTFNNNTPTIEPSTIKPSKFLINPFDDLYQTPDGYIWKFMYNVPSADILKFASSTFVPVVTDSNVANNAVEGSIEVIKVSNPGSNYKKFAYASISQAAIGGNPLIYKITPTNFSNIFEFDLSGSNTFIANSSVELISANTVISTGTVYSVSGTILKIISPFNDNLTSHLPIKIKQDVVEETFTSFTKFNIPTISLEKNAYVGHMIYVRGGTGAGQAGIISNYDITNNQFFVTINEAFSLTLDSTSKVEILPNILVVGDGSGAKAIPIIDSQSNSIIDVEMIQRGNNYTFATATVSGNNIITNYAGQTELPVAAILKPIISPIEGHGTHAEEELSCDGVCIFTELDANTPEYNSYKKIVLLDNVMFSGSNNTYFSDVITTDISLSYLGVNGTGFVEGEVIKQSTSFGNVFSANSTVLEITNNHGNFSANTTAISGSTSGAIAVISTVSNSPRIKAKLCPLYIEDLQNAINRDITNDTIKLNIQF